MSRADRSSGDGDAVLDTAWPVPLFERRSWSSVGKPYDAAVTARITGTRCRIEGVEWGFMECVRLAIAEVSAASM